MGSGGRHAFRWTQAGGMEDLGALGGDSSSAQAVSLDGKIVVGSSSTDSDRGHAFVWTAETHLQDLAELLAPVAPGWELVEASAVNADASVIFGRGFSPFGSPQAWVAVFADTPPAVVADAGQNQTVSAGAACQAAVTLDGSGSTGAFTFTWREGGSVIASGMNPQVTLPLGSHLISLTVEDAQGQTSSDSMVVLVQDTTPPVPNVATLPAISGQCSVTITAPTASDNCAGAITGMTVAPLTYTVPGTYTITWTYNDDHGNSVTQQQTVIVLPATATTLTYSGATSSSPGATVTLSATLATGQGKKAQKPSGQTVRFTLGAATASATTDATGTATVTLVAPAVAGTYPLSASYAGSCPFAPSTVSKSFMVRKK